MSTEKETHESYGLIQANRVHGGDVNLFGSSIRHQNRIMITINRASKYRDLSNDWFHPKEELIEIELSPAQFADFITSMNTGPGVPCTIRRVDGKRMPNCPEENQREVFEKDFKRNVRKSLEKFDQLRREANEILAKKNVNKGDRETLQGLITSIGMAINDSIPFVQSQFNEAMDDTVKEAKAEVEAFVSHKIASLGIAELKNMGIGGFIENDSEGLQEDE